MYSADDNRLLHLLLLDYNKLLPDINLDKNARETNLTWPQTYFDEVGN